MLFGQAPISEAERLSPIVTIMGKWMIKTSWRGTLQGQGLLLSSPQLKSKGAQQMPPLGLYFGESRCQVTGVEQVPLIVTSDALGWTDLCHARCGCGPCYTARALQGEPSPGEQ